MGQKRTKEKSPDEVKTERVTKALEETDQTGRAPAFVRENPGQFLRDMYEVWHRQGGKEGGRWRNSIRKMRDEWLVGRNAVPSLHPKLMGRVKLTRKDARALVGLFLERWRYGEDDDPASSMTKDGYVGFLTSDKRAVRDRLIPVLFGMGRVDAQSSIGLPEQTLIGRAHGDDLEVQAFIESDYRECDALITFSRSRIAIGPNPPQSIKNFLYLLNEFYRQDYIEDKRNCIFIWIIDIGLRIFEDDQSFSEFYNSGFLSLLLNSFASFDLENDTTGGNHGKLFKQLRVFDPSQRQKRWNWLSERSVVVVENLRWEEFTDLYSEEEQKILKIRLRDIGVTAQHILPREMPPNWARSLRNLVGKNIDINNISFTTLLNKNGWEIMNEKNKYLKYIAHARTTKDTDINTPDITVESINLPSPGKNYDDAFKIVYFASLYRLGTHQSMDSEEATAFAYLRKLGFQVLRIDDFVRVFQPRY